MLLIAELLKASMSWEIHEAGPKSPCWNMEEEAKALEALSSDSLPSLRFYEWDSPSITYGYFVDPWEYFNSEGIEKEGVSLARRPTGGGIILHLFDLAFSILVPAHHPFYSLNSLSSYQMINSKVLRAINKAVPTAFSFELEPCKKPVAGGFCMAKPTCYDLLIAGKKVGGAAQRKTKKGLLHQGSICLKLPESAWMKKILKPGSEAFISAIEKSSFSLGDSVDLRRALKENLIQVFSEYKSVYVNA